VGVNSRHRPDLDLVELEVARDEHFRSKSWQEESLSHCHQGGSGLPVAAHKTFGLAFGLAEHQSRLSLQASEKENRKHVGVG
jgi:hypothetical protein